MDPDGYRKMGVSRPMRTFGPNKVGLDDWTLLEQWPSHPGVRFDDLEGPKDDLQVATLMCCDR